ncbi:MAG: DUF4349 domain-containing protein [Phenylobacterium sp.]|uniref:DUF4349 domain-containing protein n=1 Tax=Phenylobacterium sp. TaxID=1871053 RepID=UPI001A3AA7E5|nr:DUF4349 domain-containing protein [Phenylobacterium sp.]MBL8556989.1 DUF4349 domain-containing protein [Phenylobacterium sp.]
MKHLLPLAAVALVVSGCSRNPTYKEYADLAVTVPAADAAAAPAADAAAAPPPGVSPAEPGGAGPVRVPAGLPMLAYSYAYGLSAPNQQVDGLRRRHEQACAKAGPTVCQVVSTSIADRGNGAISGNLSMRAAPAWLKGFRDGLDGDARSAGGRVETSDVTSEDLSREIVDTEAQLRAKTTLRDRLQALLAGRPGKLADLLEVERELARVQGEIDSAQSQLTMMRGRVAMSEITIQYRSRDVVSSDVRSPLSRSLGGFFAVVAASLAAMIDIFAVVAPWAVLLGVVLWLFRGRLPRMPWSMARKPKPTEGSPH